MSLRLVLATNHLWNNTGSELTLLGFARALAAKGHEVVCFALMTNPKIARGLQGDGLRLLQSREELAQFNPDAVYCQHHTTAAAVRGCLPVVPILLAHLGVEPELEQAPFVNCRISRHLAISEEVQASLIQQGINSNRIQIFRNAVPAASFSKYCLPRTGNTALLFSYKLSKGQRSVIRDGVGKAGLQLDDQSMTSIGQLPYEAIGERLSSARVVLASGRSAIEAMMTGAPTIVVGPKGLDGAATPARLAELAKANFSGRLIAQEITVETVRESVAQALAVDARLTSSTAINLFDLDKRTLELEHLCARAARKRHLEMPRQQLDRVSRFDRFLADHRKMVLRQHRFDQEGVVREATGASANQAAVSEKAEQTLQDPRDSAAYIALARALAAANRRTEAIATLLAVRAKFPDDLSALPPLIDLLRRDGQTAAVSEQELLLEQANPDFPAARRILGLRAARLDQWDQAIDHFQRWSEATPEVAGPQVEIARCLLRMGRIEECLKRLSAVLAREPEHAGALALLSKAQNSS
jgi:tetratricopeptide (TPR) repeat protein